MAQHPHRRRAFLVGAVLALAGAVAFAAGVVLDAQRALHAYLVAWAWGASIAIGALVLLQTTHVMKAEWPVLVRRPIEHLVATLPLFALLLVPLVVFAPKVWVWARPHGQIPEHLLHAIEIKGSYLHVSTFAIRSAVYFAIFIAVGELLRRHSLRQDSVGGLLPTARQRVVAAAGLPFVALAVTWGAWDWLMSLTPEWFSTVYGVYYWAGGFQCALALVIILLTLVRRAGLLAEVTTGHYLALGRLLLAFVIFWVYMAYSQFFIQWIGNLPEEVTWWVPRKGPWKAFGIFLVVGRFALPFALLLSKDRKRRPGQMVLLGAWLLVMHWVDMHWLVMPSLLPEGPRPHVADFGAWALVAGVAILFGLWRAAGVSPVPLRDPNLRPSAAYEAQ